MGWSTISRLLPAVKGPLAIPPHDLRFDRSVPEKLFTSRSRLDVSPSQHGESTFAFLDRVAGPVWDQCRDLITRWLAEYPATDRVALRARLRSPDDRVFTSAFWELYLHEMYRRGGWTIEIEPIVPDSANRPDFLVSRDGQSYYVEARCTFEDADRGAAARLQAVYAALDSIDSGAFHLAVTPVQVGASSPSTRTLRRSLEDWLAGLDPDAEGYDLGLSGPMRRFDWTHEDWSLIFRPIPRRASIRDSRAERPLGAFIPDAATFVDDIGSLRDALLDKGSKYGALDHPLVLAINIGSGFHDERDTVQALYGTVGWRFDIDNADAEPIPVITRAGFWGPPGRPMRTHVSGVLLAEGLHYGRVGRYSPAFWPHPQAAERIKPLAVWRTARVGDEDVEYLAAERAPHVHFHLPEGRPLGDAFPRKPRDAALDQSDTDAPDASLAAAPEPGSSDDTASDCSAL